MCTIRTPAPRFEPRLTFSLPHHPPAPQCTRFELPRPWPSSTLESRLSTLKFGAQWRDIGTQRGKGARDVYHVLSSRYVFFGISKKKIIHNTYAYIGTHLKPDNPMQQPLVPQPLRWRPMHVNGNNNSEWRWTDRSAEMGTTGQGMRYNSTRE